MAKRSMKNTRSNTTPTTTLADLNEIFGKDKELRAALVRIDQETLRHCSEVMRTTWPQMLRTERQRRTPEYASLKEVYFTAGISSARQIDQAGVTKALAPLMHHLNGFSYVDNVDNLAFEHIFLVDTMGVPARKVAHLWGFVDARKAAVLKRMSRPGFRLEVCVNSARALCDEPGGEPWEHSSPVKWSKVVMVLGVATNVAGAIASAGTAVGLAAVSIALGVGGIAAT